MCASIGHYPADNGAGAAAAENEMNPAYISALSALFGSAIGAFASLATTWLTQRHQDEVRQRAQVNIRRERVFVEFIDLSSKAFVDALQRTSIQDTSQIMPLYATMGKLRLFASDRTIEAAERVMERIIETYYTPELDTQRRPDLGRKSDVLREFAECCRAELRGNTNKQAQFVGMKIKPLFQTLYVRSIRLGGLLTSLSAELVGVFRPIAVIGKAT